MVDDNTRFIPMLKRYGVKRIFKSYDFILATIITAIFGFCIFYYRLESVLIPNIFITYATIASGMIAIIIASLAIVATMADNDFVAFLNQKKPIYNNILFVFWYTAIFTALTIAIAVIGYIFTTIDITHVDMNSWLIIIATFFTIYITLAVIQAIGSVMRFGLYRAEYAKLKK